MAMAACSGCEQEHDERWLCDPYKAMLDAMTARADSYNVAPMAFDEAVPAGLDQIADVVLRQLTVTAGTGDVGGITRPLIVLSGRGMDGEPLPRWVHIGTVQDLQKSRDLFDRMVSLAIDAARKARRN